MLLVMLFEAKSSIYWDTNKCNPKLSKQA